MSRKLHYLHGRQLQVMPHPAVTWEGLGEGVLVSTINTWSPTFWPCVRSLKETSLAPMPAVAAIMSPTLITWLLSKECMFLKIQFVEELLPELKYSLLSEDIFSKIPGISTVIMQQGTPWVRSKQNQTSSEILNYRSSEGRYYFYKREKFSVTLCFKL